MQSGDEYEYIAPYYDTILRTLLKPVRTAICRIAQRERFDNILDLCCGTGEQCLMLARLGFRVSGVDLSPAMLEVARRKSPSSIAYFEGNAASLHFEDNAFDCVIISFALHEKERSTRGAIIREVERVLGEGGKFLVADYLSPLSLKEKIGHMAIDRVERLAGELHYRSYREYMNSGALQALIGDSGAEAITSRRFFMGTTGLLMTRWPNR